MHRADDLSSDLCLQGLAVQSLHGDREQCDREEALQDFRDGMLISSKCHFWDANNTRFVKLLTPFSFKQTSSSKLSRFPANQTNTVWLVVHKMHALQLQLLLV